MMASGAATDPERERVREIEDDHSGWRRWGPYLADRSWGTVREDYSADGDAWRHLTYDKARAKADPEDLAIRITAHNRGPDAAPLHILPTLWFRNTWAWTPTAQPEPRITREHADGACLVADDSGTPVDPNMPAHYRLGRRYL